MARKVLLYGIDGGTFTYLSPLMNRGLMPNLQEMVFKGAHGTLLSSLPPTTGVAWSTIITGKGPAKHRITDFLIRKIGTYREVPCDARSRQGTPFWDYLGSQGKEVLILNVPMTYPPRVTRGAMIADGFLTPTRSRDFMVPSELLEEIENRFGPYHLFPRSLFLGPSQTPESIGRYIQDLEEMLEYKLKVAEYLIERRRPDFVKYHVWGSDIISHKLWYLMDPAHDTHDPNLARECVPRIEAYFANVDRGFDRLKKAMSEGTTTIVISDHGFGIVRRAVDLNAWLVREGYMVFKRTLGTRIRLALWKKGVTFENIASFFVRLAEKLNRWFNFKTPPFERIVASAWKKDRPLFLSLNDVDWSRTRAYAKIGIGQIVINTRGREPEGIVEPGREFDELSREMAEKLRGLKDPKTGGKAFDRVYVKEDLSDGPFRDEMADVLVPPSSDGYEPRTPSNVIFSNAIFSHSMAMDGHRLEGIFLAEGPEFKKNTVIESARLEDIAPTVLHIMDHPIPDDMDGRILEEALDRDYLAEHPVRFTQAMEGSGPEGPEQSEEEKQEFMERLKALGYID